MLITIAVWLEGSIEDWDIRIQPIMCTPEEHTHACFSAGKPTPTRYEIWEQHEKAYSLKHVREVETRPVVLP